MKTDPDHELEIERFAARVMTQEIPREQLLAEFKMLNDRLQTRPRGRGRPAGAKTKAETPGVTTAKFFFYCEALGYKPSDAARIVSELRQRDQSVVFSSMKRHAARVLDQTLEYVFSGEPTPGITRLKDENPDAYDALVASLKKFYLTGETPSQEMTRAMARVAVQFSIIIMEDTRSKP
jgi:hypothetical protein